MDGSRSLRKSFRDQIGSGTQYVNGYVREGNGRKSRTGDNHNGGPSSLRINTNFSPAKRKSRRLSGDQIDAIRAHCAGEHSPESGGSWIRRNKAARTEAMVENPAPDDSETSRSHTTPMTSRITDLWRMFLGNLETPEEHEGVEYEEKRFDSSEDNTTPLLSHGTSAPETTQQKETLLSADVPPHLASRSGAAEGIAEENRSTKEAAPPSPLTNLQISGLDGPRSTSDELNTSQDGIDGIDGKELPPLPPSAIDRPPTDPVAHASTNSASTAADAPTNCEDNDKKDNANVVAAEVTPSSADTIDHPTAGDPTLRPSLPHDNHNANVGDAPEDASTTVLTSQTQSEIVQQSSPVKSSADEEPVADKSTSLPEPMQDKFAASEEKKTDGTDKQELENNTSQVPETGIEEGASGSSKEPLKETSRLIVLERVPDPLVSDNNLTPADIPKASNLSNTVDDHIDNPGSTTQVESSPAASGEGDETPTTSATAKVDEIHPEVPVSSITPHDPSSLVVINDSASVNTSLSPDHSSSTSSSSPPAETTVNKEAPPASDVLSHSTLPDDSSAQDSSEKGVAAATQDDITASLSPSTNLQSSSLDENRLSGEQSASQEITDGRQLPHTLALILPVVMDLSFFESWMTTSNCSTSKAEDGAGACNNDDVKLVKEVKLLTQQTAEVAPSPSVDQDRAGDSSLPARASSPSHKYRNARAGAAIKDKSATSRASSNPHAQSNSVRQIISMDTLEDTKPLSAREKRKAKKHKTTKAESTQGQGDISAGEEMGERDLHGPEPVAPSGSNTSPSATFGRKDKGKGKQGIAINSDGEVQDTYHLAVMGEGSGLPASESESADPTSTAIFPKPSSQSNIGVPSATAASSPVQSEGEETGSKRGANSARTKHVTKAEKEAARKAKQKQKQRDKDSTKTKSNASSKKKKMRDDYGNFTDNEDPELLNLDSGQGDPSETKQTALQENAAANTPESKAANGVPPGTVPMKDDPEPQASGSSNRKNQGTDISPSSDQHKPDQHKPESSPESKAALATGETDRTDLTPQTSQSDSRGQVPTGNLVDLAGGETEQTTVPGPAGTSGSSSADTPPMTPHLTMDSSISPILPPLPESLSGLSIILDFLEANTSDNLTESPAVSTFNLASPLETRDSDTETIVSPTRSLFPSVSQEFKKNIGRNVSSPEGTKMSRAKAASLRIRNQELEEQCDGWKKKCEELERRHRELEKKCRELEKSLADAAAVGADWSPSMDISH